MKRVIAISLSLLVLFGSLGFSLTTHWCNGKAVSSVLSVGPRNLDCGMASFTENTKATNSKSQFQQRCCENEHLSMQIDDDYQQVADQEVSFITVAALLITFFEIGYVEETFQIVYLQSAPPLHSESRQVLFQTFLL